MSARSSKKRGPFGRYSKRGPYGRYRRTRGSKLRSSKPTALRGPYGRYR